MTRPATRSRFARLTIGTSLLMMAAAAQAQSYNAKELKPPSGYSAAACDYANSNSLSENGDVAMRCSYRAGYYFNADMFTFLSYSAYRPVVWRGTSTAGTVLSLPTGTDTKRILGVDSKGRVLALLGPIDKPGATPDLSKYALAWWDGSTRSAWATPIKDLNKWTFGNATASGKLVGFANASAQGQKLVVLSGPASQATMTTVPLPPGVGTGASQAQMGNYTFNKDVAINDQGQIALLAHVGDVNSLQRSAQAWFWNGSAWAQIPGPNGGTFSPDLVLENIGPSGDIVLAENMYDNSQPLKGYVWNAASGLKALPASFVRPAANTYATVADNGDVIGRATLPNAPSYMQMGQDRGVIYRNVVLTVLNTLITAPSGFT